MPRPWSVRLACALLFTVAGLTLLAAIVDLAFVNTGLSTYRDAYTGETGSGFASLTGATFDIFFAAGASILAILTAQGRPNARIVTLVLGGLFLFCGGVGNLSDGLHRPSHSAGQGTLADVMPAAYGITVGILDVLTVLAVLGALVLLALPASNRFFHKPQPATYPNPPSRVTPTPGFLQAQQASQAQQAPPTSSIPAIDPWAEHEGGS